MLNRCFLTEYNCNGLKLKRAILTISNKSFVTYLQTIKPIYTACSLGAKRHKISSSIDHGRFVICSKIVIFYLSNIEL